MGALIGFSRLEAKAMNPHQSQRHVDRTAFAENENQDRLNAVPLPEHPYPVISHGDITQAMIDCRVWASGICRHRSLPQRSLFRTALPLRQVPPEATLRQRPDRALGRFATIFKEEAARPDRAPRLPDHSPPPESRAPRYRHVPSTTRLPQGFRQLGHPQGWRVAHVRWVTGLRAEVMKLQEKEKTSSPRKRGFRTLAQG